MFGKRNLGIRKDVLYDILIIKNIQIIVIEALLNSPDDFSIKGFEELYSMDEQRVLANIKNTIRKTITMED